MKKLGLVLVVLMIFALAAFAYGQQTNSNSRYGVGPGMVGGYGPCPGLGCGMGPGMLPSPECNKFYDDTKPLRKKLHDNEFEYMEAARNPKTTGAELSKIEDDIVELQNEIYLKAPLGCRW